MSFPLSKSPIFSKLPSYNEFQSLSRRFPTSFSSEWCFSCRISCRKMSCSSETAPPTLQTVKISYSELKDKDADLSLKIEHGFGPNGLGILSISDVPGFSSLRQNLLHLSPRLASLPEEVKKELEDPHSRYNFGWSHGKEKLESGKPDMLKGSFYANPIFDTPTTEASLIQRYPSYCGPNIWPSSALPELEVAFKALGKVILDVGLMVAYHCDRYVSKGMTMRNGEGLEQIIQRSRCHKGLTCGLFTIDAVEVPCPDSASGLYIKTRTDQIVKAPKEEKAFGVERSTFALFLQPDWDEKLNFPGEVHLHQELIRPNMTLTFGEYSEKLLDKYYHLKP
ncbi:hypothetical protein HHK36_006134 [Tetracentron sinense]|uniref:Non-haem dioxygenase N-terminal domain-containing protein n=1 Tax=Tetracentron sinense TaxID=13715 RepID=A0A835DNT8_TETSI|nr:hypothetical protein HHK36_006134 [Tetracentron sinense]